MDAQAFVPSDSDLIACCLAGDDRAWQTLFDRHQRALTITVARMLGRKTSRLDPHVEEVAADVWLELWKYGARLLRYYDARRGSFRTFLGLAARRQIGRLVGRWQQQAARQDPWPDEEPVSPAAALMPAGLWREEWWASLTPGERRFVRQCLDQPAGADPRPKHTPWQRKMKQFALCKLRLILDLI